MCGIFDFDPSSFDVPFVEEVSIVVPIRDLTLKQGIPGPKRVLVLEYG